MVFAIFSSTLSRHKSLLIRHLKSFHNKTTSVEWISWQINESCYPNRAKQPSNDPSRGQTFEGRVLSENSCPKTCISSDRSWLISPESRVQTLDFRLQTPDEIILSFSLSFSAHHSACYQEEQPNSPSCLLLLDRGDPRWGFDGIWCWLCNFLY